MLSMVRNNPKKIGVFGLAYQGKDIVVFRSIIIEYSSLRDFGPY
jgi:hypothetical protein